jgi:hypothetical protein
MAVVAAAAVVRRLRLVRTSDLQYTTQLHNHKSYCILVHTVQTDRGTTSLISSLAVSLHAWMSTLK